MEVLESKIQSIIECNRELDSNYNRIKDQCLIMLRDKGVDTNQVFHALDQIDHQFLEDVEVQDNHRVPAVEMPKLQDMEQYEADISGISSSSGVSEYEEYMVESSHILKEQIGDYDTKYRDELQLVDKYKKLYDSWVDYKGEESAQLHTFIFGVNSDLLDGKTKGCINSFIGN